MDQQINDIQELYQEAIIHLISNIKYKELSFYGFVLAKCRVEYSPEMITAGVSFRDTLYVLSIGYRFLEFSLNERIAVLIHEAMHIINIHLIRKQNKDAYLFNISADISINPYIKHLPEGVLYPKDFNLPENESAETYYNALKEIQQEQLKDKENSLNPDNWVPKNGNPDLTNSDNSDNTFDIHEYNNDCDELIKSSTREMVKDAISSARGCTPHDIDKILKLLKREPKVSWKKELKFILSSRSSKRVSTIKRRDRRMPFRNDLRGNKRDKDTPVVVVGLDVSGSMSNKDILIGLNEIHSLLQNIGTVKIIQIDTEIKNISTYTKSSFNNITRKGNGGTLMYPIIDYLRENNIKYDCIVMISDCYIEDVKTCTQWIKHKKPVLWLNTSNRTTDWHLWNHHKVIPIESI